MADEGGSTMKKKRKKGRASGQVLKRKTNRRKGLRRAKTEKGGSFRGREQKTSRIDTDLRKIEIQDPFKKETEGWGRRVFVPRMGGIKKDCESQRKAFFRRNSSKGQSYARYMQSSRKKEKPRREEETGILGSEAYD